MPTGSGHRAGVAAGSPGWGCALEAAGGSPAVRKHRPPAPGAVLSLRSQVRVLVAGCEFCLFCLGEGVPFFSVREAALLGKRKGYVVEAAV